MGRNDYTGLLDAQPPLKEGLARTLDIAGTFDDYNYSSSETEADHMALASDWYAVGADLYRAMIRYATHIDHQTSHVEHTDS